MQVEVNFSPSLFKPCISQNQARVQILFLYFFFLYLAFITICVCSFFLLSLLSLIIGVFVVHSIVKVLVIEFLVLPVQLPYPHIKPNNQVFVNEQVFIFFINGAHFSLRLSVERTQNHRSTAVVSQQVVLCIRDRMLCELSIEGLGHTVLQFLQLSFLADIGEFLFNKFKLLLVKDIDLFVHIIEPAVSKHLLSSESSRGVLLEHPLHEVSCFFTHCVFIFYLIVHDHFVQVPHLISLERHIAVEHGV